MDPIEMLATVTALLVACLLLPVFSVERVNELVELLLEE